MLTGDEHAINDETEAMSINVMPQGVISVTIGDGSQNLRVPIDFFYKCSLHEALYSPDEIGAFGNINTLMLYNQFPAAAEETPIKIWMGITDLEDLSGGWIPADQLSLVFDGTITFPAGENAVSITLQTPFAYTGGNLVMMFNRPLQPSYLGSAYYFKAQTIGTNRARLARSDSIDYDPANPSATGTLSGQIPMITMLLTPLSDEPTFSIFRPLRIWAMCFWIPLWIAPSPSATWAAAIWASTPSKSAATHSTRFKTCPLFRQAWNQHRL